MGKPLAERTHRKSVDSTQVRMTPEEIRRASCQRSHQRREARKAALREAAAERNAELAKLTPQERLTRLDWRLGQWKGAKRERARLLAMVRDTEKLTPGPEFFSKRLKAKQENT